MTRKQPDWDGTAPAEAMRVVILAAEHAADGRTDLAQAVMADTEVDPAWLRVTAVRSLAGLVAGPRAGEWFDRLRHEAHELAADTGAPDVQVRLSLTSLSLAEAYERGAIGRCIEIGSTAEFADLDLAHAAACVAGFVVAAKAGPDTVLVFAQLRQRAGLGAA